MNIEVVQTVLEQSIGTFFALLQLAIIGACSALIKMYWDVRQLKRDVDEAHKKLRLMGESD